MPDSASKQKPQRILFLLFVVASVTSCASEYHQCFVLFNMMYVSSTTAFRSYRQPREAKCLQREILRHPSYSPKLFSAPFASKAADGLSVGPHTGPHSIHKDLIQRNNSSNRTFPLSMNAKIEHSPHASFIPQVISFLEREFIPYRILTEKEINKVLHSYAQESHANESLNRLKEWESMLNDRAIFLVGDGCHHQLLNDSSLLRKSFVLHLCPTLHLAEIEHMYQQSRQQRYEDASSSQTSAAVSAYAWLNACLSNAFLRYNPSKFGPSHEVNQQCEPVSIVHLHQDVWNRSPTIVQSRLRCKCGVYNAAGRIFARKTIVRRIHKSEYLPFLEQNHLWGATSAKYAYGLYSKVSNNPGRNVNEETSDLKKDGNGTLVAVATFAAKRKVRRAGHEYHSYELLRFCTKLNTTIVGGLTKLVSSFIKDVALGKSTNKNSTCIGIDIITSIDRDFGSNRWPGFETMDVMDPVPMFIGDRDDIRRHAIGAGLMPLEQPTENLPSNKSLVSSQLLRAGLPSNLLRIMDQNVLKEPWKISAQAGFHPVFDAGVERLMCVVENPANNTSSHLSPSELWEQSVPQFVKEHYSPNRGVEQMLHCIQANRIIM